ncbi:MAG: lysoplasmalogenase [Bacteroidales bacterium]|nr:lysoplasmalogenase [Bacteroidales bacterium]
MNAKKWVALVLFAVATAVNITGNWIDSELMMRLSKPLLMPLVLLNALLALEGTAAPKNLAVLLSFALCFHCGGDVFLMLGSFPLFVAGLSCFLIGHIFYITIFAKSGVFSGGSKVVLGLSIALTLLIVLSLVLLLKFEGPIKYAVFVYGSLLLFVAVCGLWGIFNAKKRVYWLTFCGGLIFVLSDVLVACNSLLDIRFPGIGVAIMSTYILAECLIVTSIVGNVR